MSTHGNTLTADDSTNPARPHVLFVGRAGGRLMDNVKYAFLYAATHDCGFDPLFLTTYRDEYHMLRDARLPVVLVQQSPAEFLQQAALVVTDDFLDKIGASYVCLKHLPCLQLWHGLPIKKVGFAEIESGVNMDAAKATYLAQCYSGYKAVASTSPWVTEHCFEHIFKAEEFLNVGYPRNDALLSPPTKHSLINVDTELYARMIQHKKSGGRILFYMPTFRDTGGDFLSDNALNIQELSLLCKKHNALFVAKFHPYIPVDAFYGLENFIVCKSTSDAYPLLPLTDGLITDYSSVYYDYLLLDKPVIFYAYDFEKYTTQDRALFFDYASIAHGPIAYTQQELFGYALDVLVHGADNHAPARRAFSRNIHAHNDADTSKRCCQWITDTVTANPYPEV